MPAVKMKLNLGEGIGEREVEVPGVMLESQVNELFMPKTAFNAELDRRVKSITEGSYKPEDLEKAPPEARAKYVERLAAVDPDVVHLQTLTANPEAKARVLDRLGVKPGAGAPTPEQVAAEAQRIRAQVLGEVKAAEIEPRDKKLAKASARITVLTRGMLRSQILSAAASAGVKKPLLGALNSDTPAPIVSMLEPAFGYDDEKESWFVREGNGFKMAPTPTADRLHMNVDEFVRLWASDKGNSDFIDPQGQAGPGLGGQQPVGVGSGKDIWLTPEEAADHATYEAAAAQAAKQGGVVKTKRAEQPY